MSGLRGVSRRNFLWSVGVAPFIPSFFPSTPSFLSGYRLLAAPLQKRVRITDVQTMMMQGPRTYTLVKVSTDAGLYGIGEAYGSPGLGVREQVMAMKSDFVGQDPLGVDSLYTNLGRRIDGSAHQMMRAISGVEMAIWDLNGKILDVPTWKLLGGKFRDRVRIYDHSGPSNMLDKAVVADWAASLKEHPLGFTMHKFGIGAASPGGGRGGGGRGGGAAATDLSGELPARGRTASLTSREFVNIKNGFDNVREAIGWGERDFAVSGSWNWNVRTAIDIATALAESKPLWFEDPLGVVYNESWTRLTAMSPVPILMGENLARREDFAPFVVNQGCDILHPDLRNTGGFLETKRIADFAKVYQMPMANHNTGSQVNTWASAQWAASIQDHIGVETITGRGDWMDQVLLLDGPYIQGGHIAPTDKPGLGYELNPDVVRAHLVPGETWWG